MKNTDVLSKQSKKEYCSPRGMIPTKAVTVAPEAILEHIDTKVSTNEPHSAPLALERLQVDEQNKGYITPMIEETTAQYSTEAVRRNVVEEQIPLEFKALFNYHLLTGLEEQ